MTRNSEIIFRNVFIRWSPVLNHMVEHDTEHSSKADTVADIIDIEATGYSYSHSLYLGDGQPRRVSLLIEVILAESERAAAAFVPMPPVGVPSITA